MGDFEQKYKDIATFVKKFKDIIREEIESLDLTEEPVKSVLIEKLQQVFKYDFALEDIENSYKACQEASTWLSKNRSKLVIKIQNLISQRKIISNKLNTSVLAPQRIEQFSKDIELYLKWIGHYMAIGDAPTPLPNGVISFVLPPVAYLEVFKFIRNQIISTKNGLSEEAVVEAQGYFDRFLIEPLSQFNFYDS